MCDKTLIHVDNPNVSIVDIFTFKCNLCGEDFNIDDPDLQHKCPNCKKTIFETMRKSTFKELLIASLSAIGIPNDKVTSFISKGSSKVSDMGICTELSVVIDLNFQTKFGGQYKSFSIKDSIVDIVNSNFT